MRLSESVARSLALLRKPFSSFQQTPRDVRNIRRRNYEESTSERTASEAAISFFEANHYKSRMQTDGNNNLSHLPWVHPDSLTIWRDNPEVVIVDSTYKTNAHGFPLFNMVGQSGANHTLPFALAFMADEREQSYTWALESVTDILAHADISAAILLLSDRDPACLEAIQRLFSQATVGICT